MQVRPIDDPIARADERRQACIALAGNICYIVCFIGLIVLISSAPDTAVLVIIVCMFVFFAALILNQIRIRRLAYLNGVEEANHTNQDGAGPVNAASAAGFFFNPYSHRVVPVMIVPENDAASSTTAGSTATTPGLALQHSHPTRQNSYNNGYNDTYTTTSGNGEGKPKSDGDAVYGRAQYVSGMPAGATSSWPAASSSSSGVRRVPTEATTAAAVPFSGGGFYGGGPSLEPDYVEEEEHDDNDKGEGEEDRNEVAVPMRHRGGGGEGHQLMDSPIASSSGPAAREDPASSIEFTEEPPEESHDNDTPAGNRAAAARRVVIVVPPTAHPQPIPEGAVDDTDSDDDDSNTTDHVQVQVMTLSE